MVDERPPWDLWIDYTAREPSGLTPASLRYATPGAVVEVGRYILVGADDAELAVAEVVEIHRPWDRQGSSSSGTSGRPSPPTRWSRSVVTE